MTTTKMNKQEKTKSEKVLLFQRVGAIAFCTAFAAAFCFCYVKYGTELYNIFCDTEHLRAFLSRFNNYDKLVFIGIRAFQTVIKIIPAEPLEIGSGVLYGTWGGLLMCLAGTELGSLVIILFTKLFGRRFVNLFIPTEKIDSMKLFQNKEKLWISLFIIYLIPGTPKDVLTYAAGITGLDMKKFLLITGIARIPSIITSTWCGEEIIKRNYTLAAIIFVITGIAGIALSVVYKKRAGEGDGKKEQ